MSDAGVFCGMSLDFDTPPFFPSVPLHSPPTHRSKFRYFSLICCDRNPLVLTQFTVEARLQLFYFLFFFFFEPVFYYVAR
jgi:hypothetical protein